MIRLQQGGAGAAGAGLSALTPGSLQVTFRRSAYTSPQHEAPSQRHHHLYMHKHTHNHTTHLVAASRAAVDAESRSCMPICEHTHSTPGILLPATKISERALCSRLEMHSRPQATCVCVVSCIADTPPDHRQRHRLRRRVGTDQKFACPAVGWLAPQALRSPEGCAQPRRHSQLDKAYQREKMVHHHHRVAHVPARLETK